MGDLDIKAQLAEAKSRKWDDRTLAQRAAELAQELLTASQKCLHSDERTLLSALGRMTGEEQNRLFVRDLCARVLHVSDPAEQVANLRQLMTDYGGVPPIFSTVGKLRFKAATMAAGSMQSAAIAEVQRVFRSTFSGLTLPTQVEKLNRRVRDCAKEGMVLALNPLVPRVFGNKSAERYMSHLEAILTQQEGVGVVLQPWRLCPGLNPYAPTAGAKALAERMRKIFRLSLKGGNARPVLVESGTSPTMGVVAEALKLALAGAEFHKADVALELPAYLNNTPALLRELTEWAAARAAKGAAPLKVLLLKGSHLEEEQENTFLYGEANAVCASKQETETRYKQLLHTAISAKPKAITPVIGTHNLFDLAYALLDWGRCGRNGLPEFCFKAGLANHVARLLGKAGARTLLATGVTPEGGDAGFEAQLTALVHELARPDGVFSAGAVPDATSMGWSRMRQHFLAALSGREEAGTPKQAEQTGRFAPTPLRHIADRDRTTALYAAAAEENERALPKLPLVLNGAETDSPFTCIARSLTAPGMEDYRYVSADFAAVDKVLSMAVSASVGEIPALDDRRMALLQLARRLEKHETRLIALLVRVAGFTVEDADRELRDAADACRFYEQSVIQPGLQDGSEPTPLGVVTVAPGRVHPLADAVSGIAAAWVMGNTVIYKPAASHILLGHELLPLLAEAGFTAPRFQMVPCMDNQIARKLMTNARVAAVLYSGNNARLAELVNAAPQRPLPGAPCGRSGVYLAPTADWAAAIEDLCATAFRRSGQSAATPHVVLVHAAVYGNQAFMNALKDAVSAITALPGRQEGAPLAALSRALDEEQQNLLTRVEDEETWLVQPHTSEIGSLVWTPGVRTGVKKNSLFALAAHNVPVIGLVRVENTAEAAKFQQEWTQGGFAAIYSHDEEEIKAWSKRVDAANISVNCLALPQPGVLPSGGRRTHAPMLNGSNTITALASWETVARPQTRPSQSSMPFVPKESLSPKPNPEEAQMLDAAAGSLCYWWETEFGTGHLLLDSPAREVKLTYRPLPVCIRAEKTLSDVDLSIALMAALKAGCEIELSSVTMRAWMPRALEHLGVRITIENRQEFEERFASLASAGVTLRDVAATETTIAAAARCRMPLCTAPMLANGRLELLHFLQEQVTTRKK